ncbi:hypothetical protein GDO78_023176 [Eleutherodactylus coqui]|uniref:Uncharacterized protein n=1 Tax=Eleutherodactylus coqui TaxID=57060 RepID=A0A8J6EMN5_ELECQ|nr:hypothetical protein GDO78_023176 [Eleutherodactylus coqui]
MDAWGGWAAALPPSGGSRGRVVAGLRRSQQMAGPMHGWCVVGGLRRSRQVEITLWGTTVSGVKGAADTWSGWAAVLQPGGGSRRCVGWQG